MSEETDIWGEEHQESMTAHEAHEAPALVFPHDGVDPRGAAEAALRAIDEHLAARAERERRMYLPTRIVGECLGDHVRRGARRWVDLPDVLPLGEEGGTAWTPDNAWLREEQNV
ncbi:MAG TPA: hypothetical protein VE338_14260 [Ktedonobacterales bacterium]|nr:hypothetical protein [Ktedonobacterales bacterium]